jgi:hypothetical protein
MLTVADLFKKLSYGHLSNLAMCDGGTGEIRLSDQNKVINYINEGLLRLYSRFALSEKDVVILQYGHITNYHLDKRFAVNNPDRLPTHLPYILDLPNERFSDNVIKILGVTDALGIVIPLNNENCADSVYTPYPTILQVPAPQEGTPLNVVYQAAHTKLEYGVKEAEIIIPSVLENALMCMVAYQAYSYMNTQEASSKAAEHMTMYANICAEVAEQGHASILGSANVHKFNQKGWL